MTDPRKGQNRRVLPIISGLQRVEVSADMGRCERAPRVREPRLRPVMTNRQHQSGARHARGHRFAQRSGRQDAAIAEPFDRIDHDD